MLAACTSFSNEVTEVDLVLGALIAQLSTAFELGPEEQSEVHELFKVLNASSLDVKHRTQTENGSSDRGEAPRSTSVMVRMRRRCHRQQRQRHGPRCCRRRCRRRCCRYGRLRRAAASRQRRPRARLGCHSCTNRITHQQTQ